MSLNASSLTALPARFRPDDRLLLLTAAIALLGVALVLGREIAFGVTLTPDSAHYIAAARNLLAGEGVSGFDGLPLAWWPPLYPLLLAAASLGIFDPIAVAGPLNAVIFGLTVFVVGGDLRQRLESRFLAVWGCLATALAIPLLEESPRALSDPLFILLVTLALIQTDRFLTEGRARALVWAAAFSALAWQSRYIGVAVPAFVGLLLLFYPPPHRTGVPMAQRVRRVTAYSLIVAVPMVLWLLRNYLAIGALTPHQPPAGYPLPTMLRDVYDILESWVQPQRCRFLGLPWWPLFDRAVLALLAMAAAVLATVGCILVGEHWKRWTVAHWRPLWLFGGFALTYLVLLIVAISLLAAIYIGPGGITSRYLTPLYIPLLIAGVFVLDRILVHERERRLLGNVGSLPIVRTMRPGKKGSVLVAIVTIVLSLGVAKQIVPAASTIMLGNCGYQFLLFNGPRWVDSEVLRYVRANPVAGEIFSNVPQPLSLYIGGEGMNRYHALGASRRQMAYQFAEIIPDYVIWFDIGSSAGYDYGEPDLRLLPGLEPVADLADGVVFKVAR